MLCVLVLYESQQVKVWSSVQQLSVCRADHKDYRSRSSSSLL